MKSGDSSWEEIIWEGISHPSLEYCKMSEIDTGWKFNGFVTASIGGKGFGLEYVVLADDSFEPLSSKLHVLTKDGLADMDIDLVHGEWIVEGITREDLRGCTDIDIQASPVTNTIPVRRAGLDVGESMEITAAWVKLPELKVEKSKQVYTRLSEAEYVYSSGSFKARLDFRPSGLVKSYEGVWREIS